MFNARYGYDPDMPFDEDYQQSRRERRGTLVPQADPVAPEVAGQPVDVEPYQAWTKKAGGAAAAAAGYSPSAPQGQAWYDNGGGGGGAQEYGNFELPQYGGSTEPNYQLYDAPEFQPPPDFVAPEWSAPTLEQAFNAPGYQFRLKSGMESMQNSAAAKGVLRTGGTLSDLLEYGQNFAAQEYSAEFDRALRGYGAQYKSAADEYSNTYQAAKDKFAPEFSSWQALTSAERARAELAFQREWDQYALGAQMQMGQEGWIQGLMPPPPDWGSY